jgi:hypothetical protein
VVVAVVVVPMTQVVQVVVEEAKSSNKKVSLLFQVLR